MPSSDILVWLLIETFALRKQQHACAKENRRALNAVPHQHGNIYNPIVLHFVSASTSAQNAIMQNSWSVFRVRLTLVSAYQLQCALVSCARNTRAVKNKR